MGWMDRASQWIKGKAGNRGKRQSHKPATAPVQFDQSEEFVYFGAVLKVSSTNVESAQYDAEKREMTITYLDGRSYWYGNVSIDMAEDFAAAPSKGIWVWDHLRIRGTKDGHRVPYREL